MLFFKKSNNEFKLPKNFNPGAFLDRPDDRDYKYEDVVLGAPEIDWEKGYNVEKSLNHEFEIEMQGASSSCVAQAWSKYLEVLNYAEENKFVNLSAKFIYSQIFLPQGGAYIRDGAKIATGQGDSLEDSLESYEYVLMSDGSRTKNPPTEEFIRDNSFINDNIRKEALKYQSKEYRSIGSSNPDLLAYAIMNNHGAVSGARGDQKGWGKKNKNDFVVKPPTSSNPWGHAFFFTGFGKNERGRYFDFINSWGIYWGNNGRGRMYYDEYDMLNNTFGVWTLIDQKNTSLNNNNMSNVKIIKDKNSPSVGIWLPALSPEALESYCLNFGLTVPKKADGSIDWNVWISGTLELK